MKRYFGAISGQSPAKSQTTRPQTRDLHGFFIMLDVIYFVKLDTRERDGQRYLKW
ncbi:MAG: hypothetical protein AAF623_15980 [Planctomycetota bacterium]